MIAYPAIDLLHGRVVRLTYGDPAQETAYSDAPLDVDPRWQAAGARSVARFLQRVLHEGAMRLLGLGDAQIGLAHQLHVQRRQHGLQFGELGVFGKGRAAVAQPGDLGIQFGDLQPVSYTHLTLPTIYPA